MNRGADGDHLYTNRGHPSVPCASRLPRPTLPQGGEVEADDFHTECWRLAQLLEDD